MGDDYIPMAAWEPGAPRFTRRERRQFPWGKLVAVVLTAALMVGFWFFVADNYGRGASTPVASSAPVAIPDGAVSARIDYVHDGDTLFIILKGKKVKVRLIGMDTPEIGDNAECYGTEARDYLRSLLPEGLKVKVASDIEKKDQYDRRLFYLFLTDGTFVNQELLESGAGELMEFEPNMAYSAEFHAAEERAVSDGLGMWRC